MGKIGIKIGDDQTGNILNKYVEQKPTLKEQVHKMPSLNAD